MENIKSVLQDLGFSAAETAVYLSALSLGPAPVQTIAKKAGFSRVTAYDVIGNLKKRGLMSSVAKGKKQYYMAESPERLYSFAAGRLEEQRGALKTLKASLPKLKATYAGPQSNVKFYEGLEGIKAMQEEALADKADKIYEIGNLDLIQQKLPKFMLDNFRERLDKKNISTQVIYSTSKKNKYKARRKAKNKFLKEENELKSDIIIFPDRIVLIALKNNLFGISIYDKELADSFKAIFKRLWRHI